MPVLDGIDELEDNSLNCIVTSPPYWGLRDYGEDTNTYIWDSEPSCEHIWGQNQPPLRSSWGDESSLSEKQASNRGSLQNVSAMETSMGNFCQKCPAWRGQLGLEPTFHLFIDHLIQIFDKLRAKLRKDGTLWVNLGDTYAGGGGWGGIPQDWDSISTKSKQPRFDPIAKKVNNIKAKSQIGIPERFKIAMIDNGWICRNTIIWHKPAVMPSSAKDRYTNDYEYFFFFSKNKKYYFKQQLEPVTQSTLERDKYQRRKATVKDGSLTNRTYRDDGTDMKSTDGMRNKRTVWDADEEYIDSKYEDVEQETSLRQGFNKLRGNNWLKKRNLPSQDKFVTMIRQWILHDDNSLSITKAIEELATLTEIKLSTVQHWFRRDDSFSYPIIEDWEKVEAIYKTDSIGYDFSFLINYYEETDHVNQSDKIIKIRDEDHKNSIVSDIDSEDVPYAIQNRDKSHIIFRDLPPLNTIVEYLKEAKSNTTLTIKDIEEHFGNSKGHHWFELNNGSYPSVEEWKELKKLLLFDDKYDYEMITEYAKSSEKKSYSADESVKSRNKRTTWLINTATFSEAHFAVYPRQLIESPIDACVPKKICLECDKPMDIEDCGCNAGYRKGVVLDPFCGSGTTIIEALMQEKDAIGIEINPKYVEIAKKRIDKEIPTLSPLDDWA